MEPVHCQFPIPQQWGQRGCTETLQAVDWCWCRCRGLSRAVKTEGMQAIKTPLVRAGWSKRCWCASKTRSSGAELTGGDESHALGSSISRYSNSPSSDLWLLSGYKSFNLWWFIRRFSCVRRLALPLGTEASIHAKATENPAFVRSIQSSFFCGTAWVQSISTLRRPATTESHQSWACRHFSGVECIDIRARSKSPLTLIKPTKQGRLLHRKSRRGWCMQNPIDAMTLDWLRNSVHINTQKVLFQSLQILFR